MPGRCAGCGKLDSAVRRVEQHVMACEDFEVLWREEPEKALSPKAEYERWRREEMSKEAKDERKVARLDIMFAELDRKREYQSKRWEKPRDPLED